MADVEINMDENENKPTTEAQPEEVKPGFVPPVTVTQSPGKKSKKPLLLAALIVIVIVAVVAYFMMSGKKTTTKTSGTDKSASAIATKVPVTKTELLAYQDPTLYAIDGTTKTELATVEPNSKPLRYVSDGKGGGVFYYATLNSDAYTTEVKKSDSKTSTSVYTAPKPSAVDSIAVSPDGKTLAVTTSHELTGGVKDTGLITEIISTNDGKKVTVDTGESPYRVAGYAKGGKLILQKLTCYFCDGPPQAAIDVVDATTGKVEKQYSQTSTADAPGGSVLISPSENTVMLVASKGAYSMGPSKSDLEADEFKVAKVDIEAAKSEVIYTKQAKADVVPGSLGFNTKDSKIYLSLHTAADDADSGSKTTFAKVVEAGKGSKTDISLEFTTLKNGGYISQLYSLDGKTLYIVLNTTPGVANKMSLVSLPYTDPKATTTNIFNASAASIQILGILTTTK